MRYPLTFLVAALCAFASAAQAHEFWIEPETYTVAAGDPVQATFNVGQAFKGPSFIYIPGRSVLFDQITGDMRAPVDATVGDNPAFQLAAAPEGLLIVAHEARVQTLTYSTWEKFQTFADHKDFARDFGDMRAAHDARGLPPEGFKEAYSRYVKALIGVGAAAGADRALGLRTEIIALANPYTDDLSAGLPVQVLLEGAPRADAQVEVFEKDADGAVEITLHRTDASGVAVLPVRSGHSYLVDAVTLLPLEPETPDAPVWLSLWAALTFAVP